MTVNSEQSSVVRTCRVAKIFDDPASAGLFAEYEKECANALMGPTTPEREMYEALERLGAAQCFGAYVDGNLRGFAFVLNGELPHFGHGRKFATVESLFVSRASRECGLGSNLMDALESHCREAGCIAVIYIAPVGSRLARLLFLSEDKYKNTGHTFYRELR